MATVALERPGTAAVQLAGGSKIGTGGSDFYIKTMRFLFDFKSPDAETTGDGDTAPCFENNGLLYGAYTCVGAMVASQALGLTSLVNSSKNPSAGFTFLMGGTRKLTMKVLVLGFSGEMKRNAQFVPVVMRFKQTDTLPTEGSA